MCDGGIAAWHTKYDLDILRPETAIRYSAAAFCNPDPRVKVDRHWRSLIVTPPFPAYVSGHSTFGGAGAEMLKLWFGTDHVMFALRPLDVVNWPTELVGTSRSFTSFTQAAEENGWSRIYGGVHWPSDHWQGDAKGGPSPAMCSRIIFPWSEPDFIMRLILLSIRTTPTSACLPPAMTQV